MPLNLAEINQQYMIQKICGDEEQRHYLGNPWFCRKRCCPHSFCLFWQLHRHGQGE